ncbi:MAG: hypothetical protein ACO1RX_21745 [Candidatus Sericytochromatia bacterium]
MSVVSVATDALDALRPVLDHVGFATQLLSPEARPQAPYPELAVLAGQTAEGAPLPVRLRFLQAMAGSLPAEPQPQPRGAALQFWLTLPVALPAASLAGKRQLELAQMLMRLNTQLPVGHLGWHPQEGLFLRYVLLWEDEAVSQQIVVELVEKLTVLAQWLLLILQAYVSGRLTLAEILSPSFQGLKGNAHV